MKKISKRKILASLRLLSDDALIEVMDEEFAKTVDDIDPDFIMLCCDVLEERLDLDETIDQRFKQLLYMSDDLLNSIMDSELEKSPAEMDTDLVVLCTDILISRSGHKVKPVSKKRITKKTIIKMVAVAAVMSILIATLSFVFADTKETGFKFNNVKVASYDKQTMALDYTNIDAEPDGYYLPDSEMLLRLKESGIENLLLPEVFFNSDYQISDITFKESTGSPFLTYKSLSAKIDADGVSGSVNIQKYEDFFFLDVEPDNQASGGGFIDPRSGKEIIVNGLDVIIMGFKHGNYIIQYFDRTQKTTYKIGLKCSYEKAKELAESIK